MHIIKLPLRAGMRAGLPVVTWARTSRADAVAIASITSRMTSASLSGGYIKAIAAQRLSSRVAKVGQVGVRSLADATAVGLRGVIGKAQRTAIASLYLHAGIWFPAQPERRVTYRRYGRAEYHQMLMDLLPRGRAWPRDGEDAALMLGWASELARVEVRGWDLLDEVDPRTTKELMPEWERFFELSGSASENQRRKELIAEWLAGGSMSRHDIASLLKLLGITAHVQYWRPFRCGVSTCGETLATEWFSTWTVTVYEPRTLDLAWLQGYLKKVASGGDYVLVVAGY
ncbi:putative phage tail protein [Aeromonas veronii]|uniref:putative phage tail protein n=1 Tax=Aeromonas veronii TaxID=654 RepID=UPI003D1B097C